MVRRVLLAVAAAALLLGSYGAGQAQSRPYVRIYNQSNNWLVFQLKSSNSRWGQYRIAPRSARVLYCNCSYTPYFRIRIGTTGRAPLFYRLLPNRTYNLNYNRNLGQWGAFTPRSQVGVRPYVYIYNDSNRRLVFFLKSQNSRYGRYVIYPRQNRRYTCNCQYTNYFTVRINTRMPNGQVFSKTYRLNQGRRFKFILNNAGIWDVRTIR